METAVAGTADAEDGAVPGKLVELSDQLGHADPDGVGKGAQLPLQGLAHVEDEAIVSLHPFRPFRGRDVLHIAHRRSHGIGRVEDARCDTYTARSVAPSGAKIDIAVLASGSGTNLQALIDDPEIRPHIRIVVSDRSRAPALERARRAGIETAVTLWSDHPDRNNFSEALADLVEQAGAKGVVLAGFMRILSPGFVERFPGRILNVHPSLLPAFPGAAAVEAALLHGVMVTGVTVHFVEEEVDSGPIIAQRPVEVLPDDTVDSLHARIQAEEHLLYPEVVRALVNGALTLEGRRVVWS